MVLISLYFRLDAAYSPISLCSIKQYLYGKAEGTAWYLYGKAAGTT